MKENVKEGDYYEKMESSTADAFGNMFGKRIPII